MCFTQWCCSSILGVRPHAGKNTATEFSITLRWRKSISLVCSGLLVFITQHARDLWMLFNPKKFPKKHTDYTSLRLSISTHSYRQASAVIKIIEEMILSNLTYTQQLVMLAEAMIPPPPCFTDELIGFGSWEDPTLWVCCRFWKSPWLLNFYCSSLWFFPNSILVQPVKQ